VYTILSIYRYNRNLLPRQPIFVIIPPMTKDERERPSENEPESTLSEIAHGMLELPAWDRAIDCVTSDLRMTISHVNPVDYLVRQIARELHAEDATQKGVEQGVLKDFDGLVVLTAQPETFQLLIGVLWINPSQIRETLWNGLEQRIKAEGEREREKEKGIRPGVETDDMSRWAPEHSSPEQRAGRIAAMKIYQTKLFPRGKPS
jgi:hypothetical protein